MSKTLIEIKNVSKIYNEGKDNEVRAIDNISLEITSGEFVAILGQSGSGKSTLMNILGCLDIPTYGTYSLNGMSISDINPSQLSEIRNRQIGFIFQGFNLINNLSATENVELPLVYRGVSSIERNQLAIASLNRVGLSHRLDHKPTEMSGGQQQRVAIARAISTRPPIIMADEPTGNLDSKSGIEIMDKLIEFNNEGTTIILITHDNKLATYAKRVITFQDGTIISDTKGGL